MKYFDRNGKEIKSGQRLQYVDDSSPTEYMSVDSVHEIEGKLFIICEQLPNKLWSIDDFADDNGILEDYVIMEKRV